MAFVTRFVKGFKGYIPSYFANPVRVTEHFWQFGIYFVNSGYKVPACLVKIGQIAELLIIFLPQAFQAQQRKLVNSCYCKTICKQNLEV